MKKVLRYLLGATIIVLFNMTAYAQPDTLTTNYGAGGDAFVGNDAKRGPETNFNGWSNKGNYSLIARNYDDGSATRMNIAYLKFDISGYGFDSDAYIGIYVNYSSKMGADDERVLAVYGVPDKYDEDWADTSITFLTAPGMFDDVELGQYEIDDAEFLTSITVPKDSTGWFVSELTQEMDDFISADANKLLTFMILVEESNTGDELRFYSEEDTLRAPFLLGGEPGVSVENTIMSGASLEQNYPNPFHGTTTLKYSLNEPKHVELAIYNVLGAKVATLVDDFQATGEYNVDVDMDRLELSSGIYYAKINAGTGTQTIKMINCE